MKSAVVITTGCITLALLFAAAVSAQPANDPRIQQLEQQVSSLRHDVRENVSDGGVSFLFGAFCALWAQNTGRNAWLWFFLGLFFSVITVLVLLYKNSSGRHPV